MKSTTISVRGQRVSNRSQRRYITVTVRPQPVTTEEGTYVAFAEILKRSDNINTVRAEQRRYGGGPGTVGPGTVCVVVDTGTEEEV